MIEQKKGITRKVRAVCSSCDGTGIYSGFCEAKGTAVVCLNCDGTGCMVIQYKPFEKRRRRRGIKTVSLSRGNFILTGMGALGESVSYTDFFKGKMPVVDER